MRVAFIANYEKTICFHGIAARLRARGHAVSWVSPSGHWAAWLRAHGEPASSILDLSDWRRGRARRGPDAGELEALHGLERASGVRLHDVILMDRLLRDRPLAHVLEYFAVIQRRLEPFLREQRVERVFGEQTFGLELVTGLVARRLGIEVLAPHSVRIPGGRLGFFRGHLQAELRPLDDVTAQHLDEARAFLQTFRERQPRPEYFHANNRAPRPRAAWPRKLLHHTRLALEDPGDETHFSPAWLVRHRLGEVANALTHRATQPFEAPPDPPPRPFVLFALHRQPEASIDVLGAALSNQLELVRALARGLPVTHELWVKEHSNGLGDRGFFALRSLRRVPGVRLIDPHADSFALLRQAALTVTVSGTMAYEAGLLGRRAITLAPMYFGALLAASGFDPYSRPLGECLALPVPAAEDAEERAVRFLASVLASSFPGALDNPNFTPTVLDPENLERVAAGFARCAGAVG